MLNFTKSDPPQNRARPPRRQSLLIGFSFLFKPRYPTTPKKVNLIIKRYFSKKKGKIEEGELLEKPEEKKDTGKIIININNPIININTTFIKNVYQKEEEMVVIGQEKMHPESHHVLWRGEEMIKMNGRFDGGVIKEAEKYKIYNGSELKKVRENYLYKGKEGTLRGHEFYLKLNDPKVKFESIDFPLDLYMGGSYELKEFFRKITNKIRKKHFTSTKAITVIDESGRTFSYKKNTLYELKKKGKEKQALACGVNEIKNIETVYCGHRERTGTSSLLFYDKEAEQEGAVEWIGILRIEAHIKRDKMYIIDGYREGNYSQQEMTKQIIEEIIEPSITFKSPEKKNVKQESLYRSRTSKWWLDFIKILKENTPKMGTIDDR